jgi:hypothetical protein
MVMVRCLGSVCRWLTWAARSSSLRPASGSGRFSIVWTCFAVSTCSSPIVFSSSLDLSIGRSTAEAILSTYTERASYQLVRYQASKKGFAQKTSVIRGPKNHKSVSQPWNWELACPNLPFDQRARLLSLKNVTDYRTTREGAHGITSARGY